MFYNLVVYVETIIFMMLYIDFHTYIITKYSFVISGFTSPVLQINH